MSALSFIKSTKGKVLLGTVVVLHASIYFAKPSFFKAEDKVKNQVSPPKYLPEK